jgi:chromosome segregation ATPase
MMNLNILRHFGIGFLAGILLLPHTAHAQWTVFDPPQYALQVKKRLDEALRWVDTVRQYQEMYTKTVEQLTTLRGVLQTVDKTLFKNQQAALLANDIGKIISNSQKLKQRLESSIRYQVRALRSIDDRLSRGIFDPEADLRDFQEYLLYTMGRDARQTVDMMMRSARADAQLSAWVTERDKLRYTLSVLADERKKLGALLGSANAQTDPVNIQHLNDRIQAIDKEMTDLIDKIKELDQKIEQRAMQYGLRLQDMENFGYEVQSSIEMWKELQKTKDDLQKTMDSLILGTTAPAPAE